VTGAAFGGLIVLGCIAMSATSLLAFFSLGGLVIVVGGVLAVAFMSFPASDVQAALAAIAAMLREPVSTHQDLYLDMRTIMTWAHVIQEKGRRRLESGLSGADLGDPFIRYGVNMVLGDYTPDEVRGMMTTAADAQYEADAAPLDVLHAMASHAPAFGMVGTLVGMIAMLRSLDGNVAGIGTTLAVAFLSTLYGVTSARMVYMPAAARLRQEVEARSFRRALVTEGMVMLAGDRTPTHIQDRLNGFLPCSMRDYFDSLVAGKAPAKLRPMMPHLRAVGP
jgi:chemotaxis protein MotA